MTYTFTRQRSRRATWAMVLLGLTMFGGGILTAQEKAATPPAKTPRGRLPAYYAQVVAPEQKDKIYAVQKEYAPRIKELRAQLVALQSERDAKCRALLTPEQQKKVDELIASAKAAREAEQAAAAAAAATPAPPVSVKKPMAKAGGN